MYPGTIELAAKARYHALVAEGQLEQFVALNCVAPVGVWPLPIAIRQRIGSLLVRATQCFQGMFAVTKEGLRPVAIAEQSPAAS